MRIEALYDLFLANPTISVDSRNVTAGCLFFALKGEQFDGNQYAAQAISKGASYAIVDDKQVATDPRFVLVNDVLATLQQLARYHRNQLSIPVIGITGSNGKTTTKELTGAVLGMRYQTFYTKGNLNNHIGVPLSVLSINAGTQIAVIEMGANHQGEIAQLCEIANPEYGLITNIGKAHLEGFGGYRGVIKAKSELYDHIRKNKGKLFVNADDELLMQLSDGVDRIVYGHAHEAAVSGEISNEFPFLEMKVKFKAGKSVDLKTQLIGNYNFTNIMAAACIGQFFGVSPQDACVAVSNYQPENNRSQFIRTSHNKIVMDAYNANPSSMQAALKHFAKFPAENKVLILGDMLELGNESDHEHRQIVEMALSVGAGLIILVGKYFSQVNHHNAIITYATVDEALDHLDRNLLKNSTILIKGSRGIKLEKMLTIL
jgi:UDP-N-acetylmuramoyl-tripeptide--D-alanyl-D-alanine ligase